MYDNCTYIESENNEVFLSIVCNEQIHINLGIDNLDTVDRRGEIWLSNVGHNLLDHISLGNTYKITLSFETGAYQKHSNISQDVCSNKFNYCQLFRVDNGIYKFSFPLSYKQDR